MSSRSRRGPSRTGWTAWAALTVAVLGVSVVLVRQRAARAASTYPEPASRAGALGIVGLEPVLPAARLPRAIGVTLVRDPASRRYFADSTAYDGIVARWRAELEAVGARVTVRAPAQLAGVAEPLIVPAAPCLSAATRTAVERAAARGTGALVTWLTGTRDAGCRDLGWGFLAALTGAGRADTLGIRDPAFVTVPAGGPLALDVPPGARLALRGANHVALRAARRDAHWGDAWLNPAPVRGVALLDGAVVRGVRARVAYLGFELHDVVDTPWDRAIARLLVRNLVAHVGGIPLAAPEAWPGGHAAAAVIAQDVEDEYANARGAVDTLRAVGVRSTFFVVSDLARTHEALTRDLARNGELATHGDDHRRLGGASDTIQRTRLARTQRDLTALGGRPVQGLRPPEEQFDATTLAAWRALGGTYVFASNDSRCACPELVRVGGAPFVLMGRAVDDDFILMRRAGVADPATLARAQLAGWAKVRALGGLFILSYHSNMLARPSTVGALGHVARSLRADTLAWLTTTGEVARWWRARHGVEATVTEAPGGLRVRVRNRGDAPLPAFGLRVSLPDARRAPPDAEIAPGWARVRVPALAPGATHETSLALEEATRAR